MPAPVVAVTGAPEVSVAVFCADGGRTGFSAFVVSLDDGSFFLLFVD
jgi:hypothetical protein